jgi:hypothetical protein
MNNFNKLKMNSEPWCGKLGSIAQWFSIAQLWPICPTSGNSAICGARQLNAKPPKQKYTISAYTLDSFYRAVIVDD